MDHEEIRALFDRQMRLGARPDGPRSRVERDGAVVRLSGPAHAWNAVLWSGLDETDADEAIAEQVRHFTALGRPSNGRCTGTTARPTSRAGSSPPGSPPRIRRR